MTAQKTKESVALKALINRGYKVYVSSANDYVAMRVIENHEVTVEITRQEEQDLFTIKAVINHKASGQRTFSKRNLEIEQVCKTLCNPIISDGVLITKANQ